MLLKNCEATEQREISKMLGCVEVCGGVWRWCSGVWRFVEVV